MIGLVTVFIADLLVVTASDQSGISELKGYFSLNDFLDSGARDAL